MNIKDIISKTMDEYTEKHFWRYKGCIHLVSYLFKQNKAGVSRRLQEANYKCTYPSLV